ncbi:hypothetical protein VTJ04DRAFT_4965 [Mycothermus thermophilus]|uniref:uncharacterized protein n=1 Tax=Humicola insolens TaxID=85995 RepID=UPI003741FC00
MLAVPGSVFSPAVIVSESSEGPARGSRDGAGMCTAPAALAALAARMAPGPDSAIGASKILDTGIAAKQPSQ